MIRTTSYCFAIVLLCAIARVTSVICNGMLQYGQCSTNSACGCLHMPGAGANVGICGFLGVICSGLVACQSPRNTCYEPDHICVYHPRCHQLPVCYPMSMIDQDICPPMTVANTTTTPTPTTTTTTTPTPTPTTTTTTTPTPTTTTTTTTSTSGTIIIPNIPLNATWAPNGVSVAGGHGRGDATNQLYYPNGLHVDEDQTVLIADLGNNRAVEWKRGDTSGRVVAGGNGKGNGTDQLNWPTDLIVDKETNSLIICDRWNRRVMQWSRQSGTTSGEIIIDDIDCEGLTLDDERFLYVSDTRKHEVRRYRMGEKTKGIVVAGGNGTGDGLNQLNLPTHVFVDRESSVYVSDNNNHRVMKWVKGEKEGIVVAGGRGKGNELTQLHHPYGVFVTSLGTVYVAEVGSHRVMRWHQGASQGTVVVGGNGKGKQANQLSVPVGLSFDRQGNLYVADYENNRVQRFSIETS